VKHPGGPHAARTPLTVWFTACWLFATQKGGISALGLQRALEIGSYQTAWAMLHRLRSVLRLTTAPSFAQCGKQGEGGDDGDHPGESHCLPGRGVFRDCPEEGRPGALEGHQAR
jgi:hypothetical protein